LSVGIFLPFVGFVGAGHARDCTAFVGAGHARDCFSNWWEPALPAIELASGEILHTRQIQKIHNLRPNHSIKLPGRGINNAVSKRQSELQSALGGIHGK